MCKNWENGAKWPALSTLRKSARAARALACATACQLACTPRLAAAAPVNHARAWGRGP